MIIGLVGFIGSGKGTVGEYLFNEGYKQFSFAGSLKDTASTMFGWDRKLLEGDTKESRLFREQKDEFWSKRFGYDFSPRLALQLLGTEAGRNVFHENLWIYALENRMKKHNNVVITDTRFPNEIEFIRSKGGIIVEVKRGPRPEWFQTALTQNLTDIDEHYILEDNNELMEQKYPSVHVSEWAWVGQKIDYTLDNNRDLDYLYDQIKSLLTFLETSSTIDNFYNEGVSNEVFA